MENDTTPDDMDIPVPFVPTLPGLPAGEYIQVDPHDRVLKLGRGLAIHGSPQQRAELFASLAKAQAGYQPIKRSRTVKVKSEKGDYTFDYAPLEEVLSSTLPALNGEGLALFSVIEDPDMDRKLPASIHTLLTHFSGAFLHTEETLPHVNKPQEMGSALTYKRRYQTGAITGTSPEFDDDGNEASGNKVQEMRDRKPSEQPRPQQASQPAKEPPKGAPLSPETSKLLADLYIELGYNGPACITHTKKHANVESHKHVTEELGQKLVGVLRSEKTSKGGA